VVIGSRHYFQRAHGRQRANYSSASTALWLFNALDTRLGTGLRKSAYVNDRRSESTKFCDISVRKVSRQAMRNRLHHINSVDFDLIKGRASCERAGR